MHITQKGQVTIPQHIREEFGFLPNTEVDFVIENHQVIIKKIRKKTPGEQISALRGSLKGQFSADELLKLTRGKDFA